MFKGIIGKYFLRDGLSTTESPKVFHCTLVDPNTFVGKCMSTEFSLQPKFQVVVIDHSLRCYKLIFSK